MRYIYIYILLSFNPCISQNLISNGDFETYTSCPSGAGQLTKAVGWTSPPNDDSEYLNSCSTNPNYSVPNQNNYSYQTAHSGNAFIGIITYNWFGSNYREYAQKQLNSQLVAGLFYYTVFYVNIPGANYSGKYAINNIALSFQANYSITNNTVTSNNVLSYSPHIFKYNNPIIKDTTNWVKIEGVYQATGIENYIVIGNFKDDNSTDTLSINGSNYPGSGCFIDDVSIENITTPQWQYRDTIVYLGDSVLIGPAITGLNVDWFDMSSNFIKNAPGIYVKPTVNTSYQATEIFNSAVYNHTVNVTVLPPLKVDEYDKLQNSVRLYPNPNDGNFSLRFDGLTDGNVEVSVSDITGKEVFKNTLSIVNALTLFNLDVKNGIYFVKITNKGNSIIKKLVIQQ